MKGIQSLFAFILLFSSLNLLAAIDPFTFDNPAQESQFRELTEQLRCLVCQNQSLADSNAGLAGDLRREVYQMVEAGNSNQQVVDFMVARYGDFVLYNPPVKPTTWLLWAGPLLLLLTGILILALWMRGRTRSSEAPLSEAEQARLKQLLTRKETHSHDD